MNRQEVRSSFDIICKDPVLRKIQKIIMLTVIISFIACLFLLFAPDVSDRGVWAVFAIMISQLITAILMIDLKRYD